MGKATHEAQHTLHLYPEQQTMQAAVLVKDPNTPRTYFQGICSFKDGTGEHVELMLMHMLTERYGQNYVQIPDKSTIIFVSKWSPCRQCIAQTIPGFLQLLQLKERALRVKFRYDTYYSKQDWPFTCKHPEHLWSDATEAETAYAKLSRAYGDYDLIDQGMNLDTHAMTTLVKAKLVFARSTVHKTSHRVTWFI